LSAGIDRAEQLASIQRRTKPGFGGRGEVEVGSGASGRVTRELSQEGSRGGPTPQGEDPRRGRQRQVSWVSNCGRSSPEGELGRGGGRSEGKRPGGKPQVLEDGPGGGGAKDDGHDAAGAATARASEDVRAERPLEELGPGDGAPGLARAYGLGCHRARGCLGQRRTGCRRGHDAGAQPGVGGEDAEVALGGGTSAAITGRRPSGPGRWGRVRPRSSPSRWSLTT